MNVKLIQLRYIHIFGRMVAHAAIADEEGNVGYQGTLSSCLQFCEQKGYEIQNAHDILYQVIVRDGYAT